MRASCVKEHMAGVPLAAVLCSFACSLMCAADTVLIKSDRLLLQHDATMSNLAPSLSAVAEVVASYDAKTLLITAKKSASEHWQIFEVRADGQELRQITNCLSDCGNGAYLPDGRIAFTVRAAAGSYLAVMQSDGTSFERITFGPGNFELLGVMLDGRILLSQAGSLFGIRPDGTGLESVSCDHSKHGGIRLTDSQRVELVPRPRPRRLWSTLKPELGIGHLISLDSRVSSPDVGGRLKTTPSAVRVQSLDANGTTSELGTAPVESDGSFFVAVPADRAVRFELLDARGNSIRREKTWIWARSGEERGCVGCHAEKAVSPQNHWPQTLKRFDTPTPLTGDAHAK